MGRPVKFKIDGKIVEADENDSLEKVLEEEGLPSNSVAYNAQDPGKEIGGQTQVGDLEGENIGVVQEAVRG